MRMSEFSDVTEFDQVKQNEKKREKSKPLQHKRGKQ